MLQPEAENLPVVGITWSEANSFAEWVGKRLPTQDEWEAAARGLNGNLYPWGDEFVVARAHCGAPDRQGRFVPRFVAVDSATEDTSPFGIAHLTGNVREWVFDVWVPRRDALPIQVWQRPPPDYRVVKGSSIFERADPARYRASMRGYSMPDEPLHIMRHDIGFRCAKSAHP